MWKGAQIFSFYMLVFTNRIAQPLTRGLVALLCPAV